jgi:kynurenine formamidase
MDPISEEEVLSYFATLSNWGRWGNDDELGTINLITDEKRSQALGLISGARTMSCARTVSRTPGPGAFLPPMHMMLESGEGLDDPDRVSAYPGRQVALDFIGMAFHGVTITHLDSLSHVFWEGKMYNGRPASLVSTSLGATKESITLLKEGVISRGVLLDVARAKRKPWLGPEEAIGPEDLDLAEKQANVRVEPGDIVLIRTGQPAALAAGRAPAIGSRPGLHASCLPWIHERGVAVLGSDSAQDSIPSGYPKVLIPIHQVGIVAMGLWMLDNADLEHLAEQCMQMGRWEFCFTLAPLPIEGATGSPVNPLALL